MKTFHLAISVLWACCTAFAEGACPQWDDDVPCTCVKTKEGIMVQCTGPAQSQQVAAALQSVRSRTSWDLHLDSLDLEELPANVKTVSSLRLTNCNLGRLQQTTPLAWPKLNEIVFESVRIEHNPWSQLKGANVLKSIKVSDFSMLSTIGEDFRKLPKSVEYIDLRKTGTTRFEPGCMAHLKNLLYLFIADVPLTEFPRNALPDQVTQLHTFILGNTLIEKLEPDFFDGMPNLKVLMLNGNKFSSLDSQLFMPLRSHLTHLLAERNPLQCNCNLLWLKKSFQRKRSIKVLATCYDNSVQEYIEVMKLDESEYCS